MISENFKKSIWLVHFLILLVLCSRNIWKTEVPFYGNSEYSRFIWRSKNKSTKYQDFRFSNPEMRNKQSLIVFNMFKLSYYIDRKCIFGGNKRDKID
jgi:hypothetical protein